LSFPGVKGVAFDYFGYQNYRCCLCPMSQKLFKTYWVQHPELSRELALQHFSLDTLVEFNNQLAAYVYLVKPNAKVLTHVYPVYLPEPLYGNRLNLDFCCQTAAWGFEPFWSVEKIKAYSRIISQEANRYYTRPHGAALISYDPYQKPAKSGERLTAELQAILDGGCSYVEVYSLNEVLANPEAAKIFRSFFGNSKNQNMEGNRMIHRYAPVSKRILFLGDSVSDGVGASAKEKRFSSVLTRMLSSDTDSAQEINLAISGSTLIDSGYKDVLPKAVCQRPDIFVIAHGINDNAIGHSLGKFLRIYDRTVEYIRENLPDIKIVCCTIPPSWGHFSYDERWLNQANTGIREIAAEHGIIVGDAYFKIHNRRELFPDGIHPNDEGHRVIAEALYEAICADRPMNNNDFDFVVSGDGQYRMCGYVFNIVKASTETDNNGWAEMYNVSKSGFRYRSDYSISITTPFGSYSAPVTVHAMEHTAPKDIKSDLDARGRLCFELPAVKNVTRVEIENKQSL